MTILVFDTETTGLKKPYPVSIAMVQVDDALKVTNQFYSLVKLPPNVTVEDGALEIHGISTERANAEGAEISVIVEKFESWLKDSSALAAYNIKFDNRVMLNVYDHLYGEPTALYKEVTQYCLMNLTRDFLRIPGGVGGNYRTLKLRQAYRRIVGVPMADVYNAHNALDDTLAAVDIYVKMMEVLQAAKK